MLLGGVIGAGITWTVVKSMASLGPAKAALLIVISQLIVAYVIELLGMFGVEKIAVCIPEAGRACCGTDRDCNLPVGIERQNCNKCVTGL